MVDYDSVEQRTQPFFYLAILDMCNCTTALFHNKGRLSMFEHQKAETNQIETNPVETLSSIFFFPFGILILSLSKAAFIIQSADTVVHCALTAIHYIAWRKVMLSNNGGILPDELIMMITSREGDLNAILNYMRTLENFGFVSFT